MSKPPFPVKENLPEVAHIPLSSPCTLRVGTQSSEGKWLNTGERSDPG